MLRSRSWFGTNWNRPKNRLSLDHLKYLHSILERNTTVSEQNRSLLVESLRLIAEILIWGDQHDSSVFDFFLEKNMLSYFLHIMRQKSGGSSFVCVQLLQTLNILFENIRNETSLYYLLSNNHVNSIIVHKFDFSDEDVLGYYILFLKTLSLKLNIHTIHFFFNEHTNDFPLYTEAIKFFNHSESMVRIAVRTITLNVYRVQNSSMLQFIRDKTAAPYFSNLVWFIGKHILELDICVRNDTDHQSLHKLSNLVAEHLDHLHYINDILLLDHSHLNAVLTEHLLHKLFVPLYIVSLTPAPPLSMAIVTQNLASVLNKVVDIDVHELNNPRISPIVSIYLLSLVFLVINHGPLIHALAWVLLNADHSVFTEGVSDILNAYVERHEKVALGFGEPNESLEEALETVTLRSSDSFGEDLDGAVGLSNTELSAEENIDKETNITDEEKEKIKNTEHNQHSKAELSDEISRPFLEVILSSLDATENDYLALIALCLIYSLAYNKGGSPEWLNQVLNHKSSSSKTYKTILIEKLLDIILLSSQLASRIRLITLEISFNLLLYFTKPNTRECFITEPQQFALLSAKSQSMSVLRNFYKSEDIFLDLFENEYTEMQKFNLNVEYLCMDSSILLHPTGTPLTGIDFNRRLPCGEVEKARKAIRVFFSLRKICQIFLNEVETLLPLTNSTNCVDIDNVLDLNNSDLIGCTLICKDTTKHRRFLVIDSLQFILVEPDTKRLGWGVAKFVGFLQDIEVVGDKEDSRCLHITVHRGGATHNRTPILSAKFVFDDHIRCMAAKQRLIKGRSKARQKKMYQIAQLLEIPVQGVDTIVLNTGDIKMLDNYRGLREHRQLFSTAGFTRVPGFAAALKRDHGPTRSVSRIQMVPSQGKPRDESLLRPRKNSSNGREQSPNCRSSSRTRESSSSRSPTRAGEPFRIRPRSEEIPLEDFQRSRNSSPLSHCSSNTHSRSQTPSRISFDHLQVQNYTQTDIEIDCAVAAAEVISSEETSFMGKEKIMKGAIQDV